MARDEQFRWCAGCQGDQVFLAPPCQDGHDDCPDLACVECGHAIILGLWVGDTLEQEVATAA